VNFFRERVVSLHVREEEDCKRRSHSKEMRKKAPF